MARSNEQREPLIHLSKRTTIHPIKAWTIRLISITLGLLLCGIVAFLLIDRLRANPGRIGEFYTSFIRGSFSTSRKIWKYLKNLSILLCIALALTPAFRMRFWNIGGEGPRPSRRAASSLLSPSATSAAMPDAISISAPSRRETVSSGPALSPRRICTASRNSSRLPT